MKRAFLIIHGVGELQKWETMEKFAYGSLKSNAFEKDSYQLNRLSTKFDGKEVQFYNIQNKNADIDIYEYYWAEKTRDRISAKDIYHWVRETLHGAKTCWAENETLQSKFKGRYNRHKKYWFRITGLLTKGVYVYYFFSLISIFIPRFKFLRRIIAWAKRKSQKLLMDDLGKIAMYTSMNKKSGHYTRRDEILGGAIKMLRFVLDRYDKVYLVGHSLGSVVAYDAISKLNIQASNGEIELKKVMKIAGFVSIGSPLDKIVFFFRQKISDNDRLRDFIVKKIKGVRTKYIDDNEMYSQDFLNQIQEFLPKFKWLNFYHLNDPVSGFIDFFDVDENIECTFEDPKANKWGVAHHSYWEDIKMFDKIYEELINR